VPGATRRSDATEDVNLAIERCVSGRPVTASTVFGNVQRVLDFRAGVLLTDFEFHFVSSDSGRIKKLSGFFIESSLVKGCAIFSVPPFQVACYLLQGQEMYELDPIV
jgi:hypothetical protein